MFERTTKNFCLFAPLWSPSDHLSLSVCFSQGLFTHRQCGQIFVTQGLFENIFLEYLLVEILPLLQCSLKGPPIQITLTVGKYHCMASLLFDLMDAVVSVHLNSNTFGCFGQIDQVKLETSRRVILPL